MECGHARLTSSQDEKKDEQGAAAADNAGGAAASPAGQGEALKDVTNEATSEKDKEGKPGKPQARPARERRERGPPADGIPSKTKVMVANLPYDLTEDKVRGALLPSLACLLGHRGATDTLHSLRSFSLPTSPCRPRLLCAPFLAS